MAKIALGVRNKDPEIYKKIGLKLRGRKHTPETLIKLKESALNRQKIECPHCKKISTPSMYSRWHGDNCLVVNSTIRTSSEQRNNKHRETLHSDEWKLKNYKTCNQCGKVSDPGNHAKNHDSKCKQINKV